MSTSSVSPRTPAPRRDLSGRRPETVARLLDAAVAEVGRSGFDGLTVRNVARAAGVSAASAYTYFASKEHLLTAVFWQRISSLAPPDFPAGAALPRRVQLALEPLALLVADEPELAAGVTTAMLAHDPDVTALRLQIGNEISERVTLALGPGLPEAAYAGLTMTFVGALLSAGMRMFDYQQVAPMLADFTALLEVRP